MSCACGCGTCHLDLGARALLAPTSLLAPHEGIGFIWPAVIFGQIRRVDVAAKSLNDDIAAHVASGEFHSAWASWYAEWRAFVAKHEGTAQKAGALFSSEELKREVDAYEAQLDGWRQRYSKQRTPSGEPVPDPTGPSGRTDGPTPWALYALIGAGVLVVGAVGFSVYRAGQGAARRARQGEAMIDRYLASRLP